jgi:DNA-binding MarR family transcriptional regulator
MTDIEMQKTSHEIKAALAADPYGDLGFHVKRAEQAIMARKAEVLRDLDLTVSQCMVLGFLMGGESKSCTQMAREALVTSQTMTGIVNNLDAKGFVARRTSPDHGRVVLVSLTPAGVELARRASRLSGAVEQGIRDAFSNGERSQFARLLTRVAEVAPAAGSSAKPEEPPAK